MKILVYTKGVAVEGGGGRRVASELLHHFNTIAEEAVSWSVLPLDPTSLYNGRFRYRAEHVLDDHHAPDLADPDLRARLAEHFLAVVKEVDPAFILFDTEYSLLEFAGWSDGLVDPASLPPRGVLVHDQPWKWDPAVLSLESGAAGAPDLTAGCPLPDLCAQTVAVRRVLRQALEQDRDAGAVLDDLARLDADRSILVPSDPERLDYCLAMKQAVNDMDRVFCLTPRSAEEARAAYNLAPENIACASGADCRGSGPETPDVRRRFGLGRKRGLLCFARMTREKNHDLVLAAFALALRKHASSLDGVDLWFAGQCLPGYEPYQDEIKAVARLLGVENRVRFLGSTSETEKQGLFAQAEAFVCAQAADFNLTTLQALGCGLPVIVFNGYDFAPDLDDCPLVHATSRTVADMALAMAQTLDTPADLAELPARHRRALNARTFFNYAQAVIRAFQDPFHRGNPALDEPNPAPRSLAERAMDARGHTLDRAEALLAEGDHDQALDLLNVLEWSAGPESVPAALMARIETARQKQGRTSLFPADIRPVAHAGPDMESFRGRHEGRRCFILGNGPSLKKLDLSLLKNEYTFGVNGLFHIFGEMGFKPTYYVVEDTFVAEDNAETINKLAGMQRFFGRYLQYCLEDAPDVTWMNVVFDYERYPEFPHFGRDAAERLWVGGTVSYLNMQLAYYMGFTEVYLVGYDHSYHIPKDATVEGTCITSASDDPNHIHPEYFGKGKRWHDPLLWRMEMAYWRARRVFEANGRCIMNASLGGRLDVFPRVPYNDLFPAKPVLHEEPAHARA